MGVTETFKGPDRRFLVLVESPAKISGTKSEEVDVQRDPNDPTGFDDSESISTGLAGMASEEGGIAKGKSKLDLPSDFEERKEKLEEDIAKEVANMRVCEKIGVVKDCIKEIVKEAYLKSKELSKQKKQEEYTVMPLVDQAPQETEYEVKPGTMTDYLHLENSVRKEIAIIQKNLYNIVLDELAPRWIPGADKGKRIDRRLLARAPLGERNFFKYKIETDILNVAFFLLIDESGSMYGDKARQARRCAIMFGKVLDKIGIPCMIAGFTTGDLTPAQAAQARRGGHTTGTGEYYNRSDNLRHNIYKRFHEPYNCVKAKMVKITALSENYDQDDIEWAWGHLQTYCRSNNIERKVLIVISDGQPCYSMDTEVLTEDGFKHYNEISAQDKIACFNPETEKLEYHPYEDRQLKEFDGEMVHFFTKKMDVMVTPDHQMNVRQSTGKWVTKRADDLTDHGAYRFRGVVQWQGIPIPDMSICDQKIPIEDYLKLAGYYVSEGQVTYGSAYKKEQLNSVRIYQAQYRKRVEQSLFYKMEADIKRLPFNVVVNKDSDNNYHGNVHPNGRGGGKYLSITSEDLGHHLIDNYGKGWANKKVPDFIKGATPEQIKIFLEAAVYGDGYCQESSKNKNKRYYYITSSEQLADDIQELAFKAGYAPIKKTHANVGDYGATVTCYKIVWSDSNIGRYPIVDGRGKTGSAVKRIPYRGQVFCFTVPHHLFVTRRNGHITIQGNCGAAAGRDKLRREINEIGCDPNADIIGIGIQTNYVKDFYHKCVEISDVKELGINVVRLLESAICKGKRKW
jgi:hypothetical protein